MHNDHQCTGLLVRCWRCNAVAVSCCTKALTEETDGNLDPTRVVVPGVADNLLEDGKK